MQCVLHSPHVAPWRTFFTRAPGERDVLCVRVRSSIHYRVHPSVSRALTPRAQTQTPRQGDGRASTNKGLRRDDSRHLLLDTLQYTVKL